MSNMPASADHVLRVTNDGCFTLDADWRFVEVNAVAERHFGRAAGELRGRSIWEETGRRPGSPLHAAFHQAVERGEAVRVEVESRIQPGRWFELHLHPVSAGGLDVVFHDVTEQRSADQRLREQVAAAEAARRDLEHEKRRLEAVLNALPVGVAITDATGGNIQANKAFDDVWGGPRPWAMSVDDYAAYKAWWVDTGVPVEPHEWASAKAVETGATVVGQVLEIERFDGSRAFVSNSAAPVLDADGRIAGSAVAIHDVTAMRQADAAIRESEDRYRRLFENMSEGCFLAEVVCDEGGRPIDYRYLAANPALEALTGLRPADVVGRTVREVLPGAEDLWIETYGRVALTGQPARLESYAAALGRHYSTVAYATRPGQFACLFSDITARKQSEQETQRLLAAVREEKDRLAALVNSINDEVWFADVNKTLSLVNPSVLRQFGVTVAEAESVEQVAGRFEVYRGDGSPRPPSDAPPLRALSGETVTDEEEIVRMPASGELRYREVNASPVRNADGRIIGSVSVVRDITDRKRAEAALKAANEQLRQADRRKDEFIAILSHELRNPLAPIRYALPLLAEEQLGEGGRRAMAVIDRQVGHLTRLVDDLLDVSRITSDKMVLRLDRVTLSAVLGAAAEAASPAIVAGRHSLEIDIPDAPIWLHADAGRLSQAVTNLLNNSAKYTPPGGRILLQATADRGEALVRVVDNGIGIAPEALTTVFELFRQVSVPNRPQGGLGVGLTLARKLVEMHGGAIEARSQGEGCGAEFVIRLPLEPVAPRPKEEDPAETRWSGPVRLRVLVVDDNVDLVEMLALVVESAGHSVRKAFDGPSAISAALEYHPQVILLDVGMPGMSGIDVVKALRHRPELSATRIVALTGWGQVEDRQQTAEAGFNDHLTKPADPKQIQRLLAEAAAAYTNQGAGE